MTSQIKHLFDPQRDINRKIEKVVTFGSQSEEFLKQNQDFLKQEISEYIVTDRLKMNFGRILDEMHTGMDSQSREVGIWVSGFYGSGKSSFAKYLGFAFDEKEGLVIDGVSFLDRLCDRLNDQVLSQQLRMLVKRFNPTVFMLDLATQQSSGGIKLPVGTLLYHQVMKWAKYARDTKVAYLERRIELDGRMADFLETVAREQDEPWEQIKQDPTFAKSVASQMAHRFYPKIFPDAQVFLSISLDDMEDERERMQQILDLIRHRTKREYVLFLVDEVGHYVAENNDLIFHLQGTLENLKDLGRGKAYLLGTAQQTLTEDNPLAKLNSDKLYKLNDRFPIKIDIEASDIKEITTKRLLGKSAEGTATLRALYSQFGDQLKLHTRLRDVERTPYRSDLDETQFINLYPFLPHHFNLLINLLSRLAKKTGGLGLRSAIRVVQDVLIDADLGSKPLAEASVGCLATPAHIYNVLRNDIRKSYQHIVDSIEKVKEVYPGDILALEVAKTIGVLQCLGEEFPVTVENVAIMLHPDVKHTGRIDAIRDTIAKLKTSPSLTLKELDGRLRFMTDAIIQLEADKLRIDVSGQDTLKILKEQLEDLFTPSPSAFRFVSW